MSHSVCLYFGLDFDTTAGIHFDAWPKIGIQNGLVIKENKDECASNVFVHACSLVFKSLVLLLVFGLSLRKRNRCLRFKPHISYLNGFEMSLFLCF